MKQTKYVYAIQHNVTKRMYIGSSNNVKSRYFNHIYRLRSGKHNIEDMQADFDQYGEDYSVFVLDQFTSYIDRRIEYEWMQKYQTHIRGKGYNYKDRAAFVSKNQLPIKDGKPEIGQISGGEA